MQFTTRQRSGVIIADLSGRLTAGGGSVVLRNLFRTLLDGGTRSIVLNLASLQMMDSSGLGELVAAKRSAQAVGGRMVLLNVTGGIQRVLEMAGRLGHFDIYDSERTAVASF
jgi:anti-sigma B factor antagonist